jgi:hypothetical protein
LRKHFGSRAGDDSGEKSGSRSTRRRAFCAKKAPESECGKIAY